MVGYTQSSSASSTFNLNAAPSVHRRLGGLVCSRLVSVSTCPSHHTRSSDAIYLEHHPHHHQHFHITLHPLSMPLQSYHSMGHSGDDSHPPILTLIPGTSFRLPSMRNSKVFGVFTMSLFCNPALAKGFQLPSPFIVIIICICLQFFRNKIPFIHRQLRSTRLDSPCPGCPVASFHAPPPFSCAFLCGGPPLL